MCRRLLILYFILVKMTHKNPTKGSYRERLSIGISLLDSKTKTTLSSSTKASRRNLTSGMLPNAQGRHYH